MLWIGYGGYSGREFYGKKRTSLVKQRDSFAFLALQMANMEIGLDLQDLTQAFNETQQKCQACKDF